MTTPTAVTTPPGNAAALFAWTGAAAFVISLAVFLYSYAVTFSVSGIDDPWRPALIDTALFSVFALHHSVLARTGAKRRITSVVPAWLERSLYTWIASALFLVTCLGWQAVPGVVYSLPGAWRALGYAAQAAGLTLTAMGTTALDGLDLAGVRQVLDARHAEPPRHVPLKTDGVFGIVRHPLYFGWVLFVFGAPDMTATRFVFALVSSLYLAIAVPFEERRLREVFGDGYAAYQTHTRWRIVPGIW